MNVRGVNRHSAHMRGAVMLLVEDRILQFHFAHADFYRAPAQKRIYVRITHHVEIARQKFPLVRVHQNEVAGTVSNLHEFAVTDVVPRRMIERAGQEHIGYFRAHFRCQEDVRIHAQNPFAVCATDSGILGAILEEWQEVSAVHLVVQIAFHGDYPDALMLDNFSDGRTIFRRIPFDEDNLRFERQDGFDRAVHTVEEVATMVIVPPGEHHGQVHRARSLTLRHNPR